MFEFHGWVHVSYDAYETCSELQDACIKALKHEIDRHGYKLARLQRHNGCDSLMIAGQYNHRAEYVFELFRWIAEHAVGSYGLLYILDDEDSSSDRDFDNVFRVWVLRRGTFSEQPDPFLSPRTPTVEDAFDDPYHR